MKIELKLPQQDVEANVKCIGLNGQEIKVAKIIIEPIFHQSQQKVPLLYATTSVAGEKAPEGEEPEDEEVQRFMLTLSGVNGKTTLIDRSKKVKPQFESKRNAAASKGKDVVEKTDEAPEASPPADSSIPGEIELPDSAQKVAAK